MFFKGVYLAFVTHLNDKYLYCIFVFVLNALHIFHEMFIIYVHNCFLHIFSIHHNTFQAIINDYHTRLNLYSYICC